MANPNYGYGAPGGQPPNYGQPAYAAPGQPGYRPTAPPGQPQYGAPPGQQGYGHQTPGGQPYGAQPHGYGAPPGSQPRPGPGGYGQGDYRQPYGSAQPPQSGYSGQQGYGAPQGGPPPGIDPTIYSWFMAVDQDRTGQISCTELQQALTNGNWSHFNPETCRLMIGMFDKDQSGQINVQEFSALWNYINQWRGVFEHFDRDKSGAIEAAELQTAFNQLGYNLSANFVNMVILRFDMETRSRLTLDRFIQACVLLKNVTDSFRQRDTGMTGTVTLNYEDYMCVAMSVKP